MSHLSQTRQRIRGFELSEQAEIVEIAHTIPQERIPNPMLEQIVVLDIRNVEDQASCEHSRGEDAQSPQEDDARGRLSRRRSIYPRSIS